MIKLHITQDDDGFWMLSVEYSDGELKLLTYQFVTPDHIISDARDMAGEGGDFAGALILIDPPRARIAGSKKQVRGRYRRPEAKRVSGHAF
jgi:hypothetical protein